MPTPSHPSLFYKYYSTHPSTIFTLPALLIHSNSYTTGPCSPCSTLDLKHLNFFLPLPSYITVWLKNGSDTFYRFPPELYSPEQTLNHLHFA